MEPSAFGIGGSHSTALAEQVWGYERKEAVEKRKQCVEVIGLMLCRLSN